MQNILPLFQFSTKSIKFTYFIQNVELVFQINIFHPNLYVTVTFLIFFIIFSPISKSSLQTGRLIKKKIWKESNRAGGSSTWGPSLWQLRRLCRLWRWRGAGSSPSRRVSTNWRGELGWWRRGSMFGLCPVLVFSFDSFHISPFDTFVPKNHISDNWLKLICRYQYKVTDKHIYNTIAHCST